ncbi:MAG: glycoside hydrolase family 3 protein [Treponema sp.]|uniref:glycoside hydrolase family 3 protein n=1 Tax=Treponema sp. TaxID=166 RepID=UPI00298E7703|nr:glycoside hydrolase family 3 C-terminal domain-containing protein [Treponema sp.]MBR5934187.1 glycoside hydrolase family 3 protein [Treponema sp.]
MKKILDWTKYVETAREVVQEGCVLLENKNEVLPFAKGTKVAVFGRIQNNYYKSGTGSGGMVNVNHIYGIPEGLKLSGRIQMDSELEKIYADWEKENPFVIGEGWGAEPWSQKEMSVSKELAQKMSLKNDAAIIIIGRNAGEDKDNSETEGSWFLTEEEKTMIKNVRSAFEKVCVILNTANIIDMNFIKDFDLDCVLLTWQGGMIGGLGIADILTGKVTPSGKLTDTIASSVNAYPSTKNFGDETINFYEEDIYVGYRYFESAAKDKVLYPFGYGLSYTDFAIEERGFNLDFGSDIPKIGITVNVKNTGKTFGKESVQIYVKQPQGKLGKPALVLADFKKTSLLKKGKSENLSFEFDLSRVRSFDDTGVTGNIDCFVLEEGKYEFFAGNRIDDIFKIGELTLDSTRVIEKVSDALKPVKSFERLKASSINHDGEIVFENEKIKGAAPYQNAHRLEELNRLEDFFKGEEIDKESLKIAQSLSDEELACIIRGEGMGSPKVTPGTAGAFGGVSESLKAKGIPCACCTDGPSGIRLDSGAQAFSLPNGTLQACTLNPELIEKLYSFTALEMLYNKIDVLLGPGINIRRHPLNGRNFEYFSEDPYITGVFTSAIIRGLNTQGVTGSLKHFCCNNQETGRRTSDFVVSARALREIYLVPFEMAVKNGATVIMTAYGSVNGLWTAGSFDLNTLILRKDWGFKGIVMTDWWAVANDEGKEPQKANTAQQMRAQNDIYMVVPEAVANTFNDNTEQALKDNTVSRLEVIRSAYNIINFVKHSNAQKRFEGKGVEVKIKNRPPMPMDKSADKIVYYDLRDGLTIPVENVNTTRGSTFGFGISSKENKKYRMTITCELVGNEVAQINTSLAWNGVVIHTFGFTGQRNGREVSEKIDFERAFPRFLILSLFFSQTGLKLKEIKFTQIG